MRWHRPAVALAALCALGIAMLAGAAPPLLTWPAFLDRAHPTGAVRIAYGPDKLQFGELWLPKGGGRHPLVMLIHGGCWQTSVADLSYLDWAAADLAGRGIAVWNIEYRGVDRPGGGYPGTFQDVAAAADALRRIAPTRGLDLGHVVAVGHSAGGHLALWLAGRGRLPRGSVLRAGTPLPIYGVVSLGGLPDLKAARDLPGNDCGVTGVPPLVGRTSAARPDVFADTSASALLPIGVRQTLIHGARDPVSPPAIGSAYVAQARRAGDDARTVAVPASGHIELIAPGSAAWAVVVARIRAALGPGHTA